MQLGADLPVSDPWLAGLARSVQIYTVGAASRTGSPVPIRVESLPDGTMTLLYRRTSSATGDLSIAGPRTRAIFKTTDAAPLALSIRFAPGAASAFLGLPAHLLTDRIVRLEHVWGAAARPLLDELLETEGAPAALDVLARALRSRAARTPPPRGARLARRAARLIELGSEEPLQVEVIAATLGVSSRHLRRVLVEHVGLSPKELIRSARLQRAIALAGAGWAEIASAAGYYDQAHLIDDFRDLMGITPGVFARRHVAMEWPRRCLT